MKFSWKCASKEGGGKLLREGSGLLFDVQECPGQEEMKQLKEEQM